MQNADGREGIGCMSKLERITSVRGRRPRASSMLRALGQNAPGGRWTLPIGDLPTTPPRRPGQWRVSLRGLRSFGPHK